MTSSYRRFRLLQIRTTTKVLNGLGQLPLFSRVSRVLTGSTVARSLCLSLTGYRRPFKTFAEARQAVAHFRMPGHEFEGNIQDHLSFGARARPSDYAALFHLSEALPAISTVLDVGGNAGNLFYCYAQYLRLPENIRWIVYDLPATIAAGEKLARQREETRLAFTPTPTIDQRIDLLLVSGALHYFDEPLSELIAKLPNKPGFVLINRTPMSRHGVTYTVQDAESHLVACKLVSEESIAADLRAAGFVLVDRWDAFELSLKIPLYPDLSSPQYTGMYWRYVGPPDNGYR